VSLRFETVCEGLGRVPGLAVPHSESTGGRRLFSSEEPSEWMRVCQSLAIYSESLSRADPECGTAPSTPSPPASYRLQTCYPAVPGLNK
jgi:hypothetical protein